MQLDDVRRVLSHPVALGQCREFLRRHPAIEPVAVFDTAGAVEIVTRENDGSTAAIAGRHPAHVYGGTILAEHLQDQRENWTRFVLVAHEGAPAQPSAARKMLLVFDLPHKPGALVGALEPLARRQIDITKLESRPIADRPFEYRFILELAADAGRQASDAVSEMRERTTTLRVLGEYPAPTPAPAAGAAAAPGAECRPPHKSPARRGFPSREAPTRWHRACAGSL